MAFADDELGNGQPIELFAFSTPQKNYNYTSGDESYYIALYGTFEPLPIRRSAVEDSAQDGQSEVRVTMPVSSDFVQENLANPPRGMDLTISRVYPSTGSIGSVWRGKVAAMTLQGREAVLRVPGVLEDPMATVLPRVAWQPFCNNVLYDQFCGVDIAGFTVSATVSSVSDSGTEIVVSTMGGQADGWALGGEIKRLSDGARRLILGQVGTVLTLSWPFHTLSPGDGVELYAGCDHLIGTCDTKFSNRENFGGHPTIPSKNLYNIYNGLKGS